jgi:hypothetical protein
MSEQNFNYCFFFVCGFSAGIALATFLLLRAFKADIKALEAKR